VETGFDMSIEPITRFKQMFVMANFSFDSPDVPTVWEVFKAFIREPSGLKDASIEFRAGRCGLPPYQFGLDFDRFFWIEAESERFTERLHAQLTTKLPRHFTLRKTPTCLRLADYAGLEDFFAAVERRNEFQLATSLSPWAFELKQEPEVDY
jgi:hypothetical protein